MLDFGVNSISPQGPFWQVEFTMPPLPNDESLLTILKGGWLAQKPIDGAMLAEIAH
jgi:hypothetical protein